MGCTAQYTQACSVGGLGTVHPGLYCRQPWHSTPRPVLQVALARYTQAGTVGTLGAVHPEWQCRLPWHSTPRPVLQVALAQCTQASTVGGLGKGWTLGNFCECVYPHIISPRRVGRIETLGICEWQFEWQFKIPQD